MSTYTVRAVAENVAKGNGLYATRNIRAGEAIIAKNSLLSLRMTDPSNFSPGENDEDATVLQSAIDGLDAQQRDDFLAVYCNQSRVSSDTSGGIAGGWTANLDRVLINRFVHDNYDGSVQVAVFKHCSRANNSCVPNAYFCFGDDEKGVIRAVTHIAKEEEITIAYLSKWMTRSQRASAMDWIRSRVVRCDCKACTDYTDDPEKHAYYQASNARGTELESLLIILQRYYPIPAKSSWKFCHLGDAIEEEGGTLWKGTHPSQRLLFEAAER